MKLKLLPQILAVAGMIAAPVAHASIFVCHVATPAVLVFDNGPIGLSIDGTTSWGFIYLCNLSSATDAPGAQVANIPTETCKGWYNTIMAAKAMNKNIYAQFDTTYNRAGSGTASSCDSVISSQAWTYPNPAVEIIQINY